MKKPSVFKPHISKLSYNCVRFDGASENGAEILRELQALGVEDAVLKTSIQWSVDGDLLLAESTDVISLPSISHMNLHVGDYLVQGAYGWEIISKERAEELKLTPEEQ